MDVRYEPAADALGHTAPLTESLELPLLGVPARYRSNSPTVIGVVERALGRWRDLPARLIAPGPPVTVDIVVHPAGHDGPPPGADPRFVFRVHGDTFAAAAGASLLTARMARGEALAFVTPELAADEPNLRHNVVECLGFLLVNERDRTPIHAAAVVRRERAVLLVGESTAGKSTLCYACVRAGFALLAEDTVCVSLERGLRIWGHAGPIHLLPDAPRLFPELAGLRPAVRANGKLKLAFDVANLGPERLATHAERATVCLIERGTGQASRIEPLDPAEAAARIAGTSEQGFALYRERAPAVAAALTAGGAYRLSVGTDPGSAALLLAHLTDD